MILYTRTILGSSTTDKNNTVLLDIMSYDELLAMLIKRKNIGTSSCSPALMSLPSTYLHPEYKPR